MTPDGKSDYLSFTFGTSAVNYTPLKNQNSKAPSFFMNVIDKKIKVRIFTIMLLVAFISSLYSSFNLYKFGGQFLKNIEKRAVTAANEIFPDNLEIKIQNGTASSNVQEPYYLTATQSTFEDLFRFTDNIVDKNTNKSQSKLRLLTINTQGKIEDFEQFQSMAMLTAKNLVYYNEGKIEIQSLSSIPNISINKTFITSKLSTINPDNNFMRVLNIILYASPILIMLFKLFSIISANFINTIFIYLLAIILSLKIPFGNLFRLMGIFYVVSILILTIIGWIPFLAIFYSWISTLFTVLGISIIYVILLNYKKRLAQKPYE